MRHPASPHLSILSVCFFVSIPFFLLVRLFLYCPSFVCVCVCFLSFVRFLVLAPRLSPGTLFVFSLSPPRPGGAATDQKERPSPFLRCHVIQKSKCRLNLRQGRCQKPALFLDPPNILHGSPGARLRATIRVPSNQQKTGP